MRLASRGMSSHFAATTAIDLMMNAEQIAAFKQAAGGPGGGYSPEVIGGVIACVVAAICLAWGAYAVFRIGAELQDSDPGDAGMMFRALLYKLRILLLLAIVLYVLT